MSVATNKNVKQEVFDVALEGLAQIWLKMPEMLQDLLETGTFFETLIAAVLRDKKTQSELFLHCSTKAQILRTLVRYL